MPRLFSIAVAQHAIADAYSEMVTLVNLLESVRIAVPEGEEVPRDLTAPTDLHVYTKWAIEDSDKEAGDFEENLALLDPDGIRVMNTGWNPLNVDRPFLRWVQRMRGFPVWLPGVWLVQVSIRQRNEGAQVVGEWPIVVIHYPLKKQPDEAASVQANPQSS